MNPINSFFDKIYCINLESRVDRWESCLKQFSVKKIENVEKKSFDPVQETRVQEIKETR